MPGGYERQVVWLDRLCGRKQINIDQVLDKKLNLLMDMIDMIPNQTHILFR